MVEVLDYYPPLSRRRNEQGAPTVRVCVDPSGKKLRKPEVTKSSGYREIDAAAIRLASDVTVTYADRQQPTLSALSFEAEPHTTKRSRTASLKIRTRSWGAPS